MDLVGRGLEPDEARRVVEEHYAAVLAYCRRHTPSTADAEDAAQETFLRFVRCRPTYRDRGRPRAFLLTIARNVCVDQARLRQREPAELTCEPTAAEAPDPDLALALEALGPEAREVIELRYGQGLRVGEVAQVLGLSRFAATRRINRALEALRHELGTVEEGERGRNP